MSAPHNKMNNGTDFGRNETVMLKVPVYKPPDYSDASHCQNAGKCPS
jgi:hypothetical protein